MGLVSGVLCDRCWRPYVVASEHGQGVCPLEPRRTHSVRQDTLIGGFWAENAWREPRYFDSQKRYEKALDDSGLMLKPKKLRGAEPITAETLEWARQRLERMYARTKSEVITETVLDETIAVEADELSVR